ncbi:MAG: hypothetical protein O7H41_05025 [Planctomycetota bacterium]|nr:hypothetical protein [Planctomycetota bacterium]
MRLVRLAVPLLSILPLLAAPANAQDRPVRPSSAPTDRFGDRMPKGAIRRFGSVRFRHEGPILSLDYSSDGSTIASGSRDGTVRIWDVLTGRELQRLELGVQANSVTFSPDGKQIAAGGGADWVNRGSKRNAVRLWSVETGKRSRRFRGDSGPTQSIAFSPDGATISAAMGQQSQGGATFIWDATSGNRLQRLQNLEARGWTSTLVYSPDSKTLVTASDDQTIRLWDVATGKDIRKIDLAGLSETALDLAMSPDGKTLASVSGSGKIRLWSMSTGNEELSFGDEEFETSSIAFSPDGKRIAAAGEAGAVRIWSASSGDIEQRLDRANTAPNTSSLPSFALEFSPDGGTLAVGGEAATILFWDLATGKEVRASPGHEGHVSAIAFSPDGAMMASAGGDLRVRLWKVSTADEIRTLSGHTEPVRSVAFSPDGGVLASGGDDSSIRLWEISTGKEMRLWELGKARKSWPGWPGKLAAPSYPVRPVTFLQFGSDGKGIVAAAGDDSVYYLDPDSGIRRTIWRGRREESNFMRVFQRNRNPNFLRSDLMFEPWQKTAAVTPDGEAVVFRSGWTGLRAMGVGSGESRYRIGKESVGNDWEVLHSGRGNETRDISYLTLSPDGLTAMTGLSNGAVQAWEIATGKSILEWRAHQKSITSLLYSPDGRLVATSALDDGITLWDSLIAGNGLKKVAKFSGHGDLVFCLAFTPRGSYLASGGTDGTILLWDIRELAPARASSGEGLSDKALEALWSKLAAADPVRAHRAIATLAGEPESSLPFLQEQIRPQSAVDDEKVRSLIALLDDGDFDVREGASRDLRGLGRGAESFLRKTLQEGSISPEVKIRVKQAIAVWQFPITEFPSEALRTGRAIRVLEAIGDLPARELLKKIAEDTSSRHERNNAIGARLRMEMVQSW